MLAVAGGKGGVGKTTTVLGLAAALPGSPLAVDADVDMPDLHRLAGVDREPGLDAIPGAPTVEGVSQPVEPDDYRVLAAPNADDARTATLLDRLACTARGQDLGPVLVDTPAGASADAAAPLRAADGVVIVSTACAPALRDATKTASMARAVGTPVVGAVLTRTLTRPPGVGDLLDCPVLGCIPEEPGRPLASRRVRNRYEAAANRLDSATLRPEMSLN